MSTQTSTITRRRARTLKFEDGDGKGAGGVKPPTESEETRPNLLKKLRRWSELPEWQKKDGKIIHTGYRQATPSISECIKSWFYLHNESVNIFTHLGGALLFVTLAFALYGELSFRYSTWTRGDVMAFGIFMFGVATCFACSAAFHTCASHSVDGYHFARRCDFQGIIILVLATSAPQVFYTFYDAPALQQNYWSLITFFGLVASIMTFTPYFQAPAQNSTRVAVFAGLGFSTFAPIVHGCIIHGLKDQSLRFPLWVVGLTHTFNVMGATVYVLHFPERWWPKTFDIFGASHQLMHSAIVCAALTLLTGSLIAFDNVHSKA